ncbi:MAG: substrate-binding domain-containing protein [Gammaproteobacteria bacterium]
MSIGFEVRWKLQGKDTLQIEPDLFNLLQEIESSGSLLVAARTLGISYRYAWELVRKWSARIGHPLAELQRGRGTKLTAMGAKLLWAQRKVDARLGPMLESLASEIDAEIRTMMRTKEIPPLRVHASHGLAIAILRDMLNAIEAGAIDLQFRGSLDSLRVYRNGKCDIAGFHLPEGRLGAELGPRFRRLLDPAEDVLIHVVRRDQGMMTAAGNPKKIAGVKDLPRKGVTMVNRQPGSGTRLIVDAILADAGVDANRIHGYGNEEFTHMAVAAIVASGAADAGFGIRAAAAQLGLTFIPLVQENYLFVLHRDRLRAAEIARLRETLRSDEYRRRIAALPGYDAALSGNIVDMEGLFQSPP